MGVNWRDMSIPYSEEELEEFTRNFKSMQEGNGGSIPSDQVPKVLEIMRFKRTPDQMKAYTKYWNDHHDGLIDLDALLNIMTGLHSNKAYFRALLVNVDKNKDGFISEGEFDKLVQILPIHDPTLETRHITFQDFVKEADTDGNGRVSIDEATDWLKHKIDTSRRSSFSD